jgi:hypothetical protein
MNDTSANEIVVVAEVAGQVEAEVLRGLLMAQDISVALSEESAARTIGITLPGMGIVQVLVRGDQAEAARQIVESYNNGLLEGETLTDEPD